MVDAAAQAAMRERQRVAVARRQWRVREQEHARLRARLGARGVPEAEWPAVLVEPRSWDAESVRKAIARAENDEAAMRGTLARLRTAEIRREVAGDIRVIRGGGVQAARVEHAAPLPSSTAAAQAADVLARLDPDAAAPPELIALADRIGQAPAGQQDIMLAGVRDQVRLLNETARDRRKVANLLAEGTLFAEETGDTQLRVDLMSAATDQQAGREVDPGRLRHALAAAQQRQLAELSREHTLDAITAAFRERDYVIMDDLELSTPVNGKLLRHKASDDHAMEVVVDGTSIRLEPVRLEAPGTPVADHRAADRKADAALCADATSVLKDVQGVEVDGGAPGKPGAVPLKAVPVTGRRKTTKKSGTKPQEQARRLDR